MEQNLAMLKIDLGITTTAYDNRLTELLGVSAGRIAEEGITLDATRADDNALLVMYAGWLWRKRDTMEGMPRMLRYALNNRLFAEKMNAEG